MGKNKQAQCKTCSKQMRADHMKRHLQVSKAAALYRGYVLFVEVDQV